jgi:hypothetical protein
MKPSNLTFKTTYLKAVKQAKIELSYRYNRKRLKGLVHITHSSTYCECGETAAIIVRSYYLNDYAKVGICKICSK